MRDRADVLHLAAWIALIEFAGALVIAGHCVAGLVEALRSRNPAAVRLLVIEGSLWGLSLKTAASLLKTIEVHSWEQIAAFTAILALRTLVKRVMTWEEARLRLQRSRITGYAAGLPERRTFLRD